MTPADTHMESMYPDERDYNKLEHFRRHKVEPPSGYYVDLDDVIVFESWAVVSAAPFNVSIRMLSPDGSVVPIFQQFTAAVNGVTPTTNRITNLEGFLLSVSVNQISGIRGNVYIRAMLQRGVGSGDATRGAVILSGYTSFSDAISFPNSEPDLSLDGRGLLQILHVADAAAGADVSIPVPAGVNWILRGICMQFSTSATVANRIPVLRLSDSVAHIFAQIPMPTPIAAGTVGALTWASSLQPTTAGSTEIQGLPAECRLGPGFTITTATTAIQATDQYTNIVLELETFVAT